MSVQRGCILVCVFIVAILSTTTQGERCPDRIRPTPGITSGNTLGWSNIGGGYDLHSGDASNFTQHCCPSGTRISNWTIGLTADYEWVGEVSATCRSGEKLPKISLGYNGTGAPACNSSIQRPASTIVIKKGIYSIRADDAIYQLLGIGRPYANVEPFSFQCRPGLQPIGFGARSSCYSIVDFQVICGPVYGSENALTTNNRTSLQSSRNVCPSDAIAVPEDGGVGNSDAWVDTYNPNRTTSIYNPTYSSAAGPMETDCCNSGQIVNFTVGFSDYRYGTLGRISALCSDGNLLSPIKYGGNFSESAGNFSLRFGCDDYLEEMYNVNVPSDGRFIYKLNANNTIAAFIVGSSRQRYQPGAQTLREFSCPEDYVPIGISAASACVTLANLQIICGPADNATLAPAPAPRKSQPYQLQGASGPTSPLG